jgi:hypothetical protein
MGSSFRSWTAATACLLLAAIAIPAASQEPKPLTGTYAIAGKEAVDPPPDQANDTHLQLFLSGNAARDLYKAMKVKAVPDECIGQGAQSKFEGGIACTMHAGGKEYECSLAIDIKNQKLDPVYAC